MANRADIEAYNSKFLHGVGRVNTLLLEEGTIPNSPHFDEASLILKKIELIWKFGILSINMQKKLIGKAFRRYEDLCWNGVDHISLSDPVLYKYDSRELDHDTNDFHVFHNPYLDMAFVISRDISGKLEFRDRKLERFSLMDTEVQVKDMIDKNYILGLRVPSVFSKAPFEDEEVLENVEGFYDKIFEKNILFLQQHFSDLPLYASFTGEEIPRQLTK